MLDDILWNSGSWIPNALVGTTISRGAIHYAVPQAASKDHARKSLVVTASVEEKVSDLIRSYPHLELFLKSHSRGANARIRDLELSTRERNHLLYQILAARRQELLTSGTTGQSSLLAHGSRSRQSSYELRRKRLTQPQLNGFPKLAHPGPADLEKA